MRRSVLRCVRWVLIAAGMGSCVPVIQVVWARFADPWFTFTMAERAYHHPDHTWPDYQPLPLAALGDHLPKLVITSEDSWFFHHNGFDCTQIQAALQEANAGGRARGASTISQQVAKNLFLWQGRSWIRKGLEVGYTVLIEALVPKRRILELYLSIAETSPNTFGFEAGARYWYGQSAATLTPDQAARLVAILPSPRRWSLKGTYAAARARALLAQPVPWPGEPGYDQMARTAPACTDVLTQWLRD